MNEFLFFEFKVWSQGEYDCGELIAINLYFVSPTGLIPFSDEQYSLLSPLDWDCIKEELKERRDQEIYEKRMEQYDVDNDTYEEIWS